MRLLVLVLGLCVLSGCYSLRSYARDQSERLPEPISRLAIDLDASAVEISTVGSGTTTAAADRELLVEVAQVLGDVSDARATPQTPARFRLRGAYEAGVWPLFACLISLTVYGCPAVKGESRLVLELQVDDTVYVGQGDAVAWSGLYYNSSNFNAAVGRALGAAVADLARSVPRSGGGDGAPVAKRKDE